MAVADSTKPSPSKQPVTETTTTTDSGGGGGGGNGTAGATEKAAAAAAAASTRQQETLYAVTGTGRGPTYADTEESVHFLRAKGYLSRGQFERALSAIEKGIEDTKSKLHTMDRGNGNDNDNDDNEDEDDDGATTTTATFALHESLAPFHYLYATTLLYSLEELPADRPTDTSNNAIAEEEEKSNKEDSIEEETEAAAAAESMNNKMADFQTIAQDMQIAWENFEIARTSIEAMISERQQESSPSSSFVEKLKLDLSKVYLRKGDLQSASGNFDAAVRDYTSSLVLRQGSAVLERFDRAVADVQYNLGLAYIMLATSSETSGGGVTGGTGGSSPGDDDNNDNENDNDDDDDDDKENDEGAENATAAATAAAADNVAALPPPPSGTKQKRQPATETAAAEVRQLHRKRSSYNFLECGRTLCGKIALLCNADPDQVLRRQQQIAATNHGTAGTAGAGAAGEGAGAGAAAGAASAAASASDGGSDRLDEPAVAAKKLHHLRKYVATALKPAAGNENDVTEFRQVLDEIQATMDATGAVVD